MKNNPISGVWVSYSIEKKVSPEIHWIGYLKRCFYRWIFFFSCAQVKDTRSTAIVIGTQKLEHLIYVENENASYGDTLNCGIFWMLRLNGRFGLQRFEVNGKLYFGVLKLNHSSECERKHLLMLVLTVTISHNHITICFRNIFELSSVFRTFGRTNNIKKILHNKQLYIQNAQHFVLHCKMMKIDPFSFFSFQQMSHWVAATCFNSKILDIPCKYVTIVCNVRLCILYL